jgi:hypothetical protein
MHAFLSKPKIPVPSARSVTSYHGILAYYYKKVEYYLTYNPPLLGFEYCAVNSHTLIESPASRSFMASSSTVLMRDR